MKIPILIIVVIIVVSGCCSEKNSNEIDVVSSMTLAYDNCYIENIMVIVNQSQIDDYEECAKAVISQYIANDFKSTIFNFEEMGYPCELKATIFLSSEDLESWHPDFQMIYKTDCCYYNIKDHSEKCTLTII